MSTSKTVRRVCSICGIGFRTPHSNEHLCEFCSEQGKMYDANSLYQDDHLNTDKVLREFSDYHHGENDGFAIKGHRV